MIKILESDSQDEWSSILNDINKVYNVDIYFDYEYLECYLNQNSKARAFLYKDINKIFFLPFIQSTIPNQNEYYDFETVYGYSGPITNTKSKIFIEDSFRYLISELKKNKIIAGLIRFNPFLNNHEIIPRSKNIIIKKEKKIVYLDLKKDKYKISKNGKRNLNKSQKYNIEFSTNINNENIKKFYNLYSSLMLNKKADEYYNFNEEYFKKLFKNNYINLILAEDNNKVIGGIIYSVKYHYLNILLSAVNNEGLKKGVAYLLRNKIIIKNSDKLINFGGGLTSSENDSLLKYKMNFSDKTKNYYIGKLISNHKIYNSIVSEWENKNFNSKYFNYHLKYRY